MLEDTSEPFACVGRQHTTPVAKGHRGTWFLIHRKVISPVPSLQGFRTVKILILTTTIHDQKVTMVQPGRASVTVQTRPRFPFEKRRGSKTLRNNEFGFSLLPKQTLLVAVPPNPTVLQNLTPLQCRSSKWTTKDKVFCRPTTRGKHLTTSRDRRNPKRSNQ